MSLMRATAVCTTVACSKVCGQLDLEGVVGTSSGVDTSGAVVINTGATLDGR